MSPGARHSALIVLLSSIFLFNGCQGRFDPLHPDIILIVVDTLRADHLGAYGYERDTSPRIDALARQATVFDEAWSASPWTLPSVMSIMTSRIPSSHRVENDGLKLATGMPTLAETLRGAGYVTGGFISNIFVAAPYGFSEGFQTFEDFGVTKPGFRPEKEMEPTADRVTDAALAWFVKQDRRPLFLFVHYFDPHWPYDPPERIRALFPNDYRGPLDAGYDSISKFQDPLLPLPEDYRRFLIDRYNGEIRFTDEQIGRLLDGVAASERWPRTWVILTSDHGEEFKDHGSMGHGRRLYEESVHVPLIIGRMPKPGGPPREGRSKDRVPVPVSGIDLFPTIADIAAVDPPAGLQGESLVPLLHAPPTGEKRGAHASQALPVDRPLVCETIRLNAHLKAIRRGPFKLIQSMDENRTELYDLTADPGEREDLSEAHAERRTALARDLFARVDFLSGGWNVRWSGDGRKRRFQGQIRTQGIFRTVVPLFQERGKYVLQNPSTLSFTDADQTGSSGLSFTIVPENAGVEFYLMIDGRPLPEQVFLGGHESHPRSMPFTLEGQPSAEAAYSKPGRADGKDLGFFIWRLRSAGADQTVVLDEEIRQRLRSLGYIN